MLDVLLVIWYVIRKALQVWIMTFIRAATLQPPHMIHGGNLHGLQLYEVTSPAIARPSATIDLHHQSQFNTHLIFTSSLAICGVREALANSVSFIHHPDIKNPPPPFLPLPLFPSPFYSFPFPPPHLTSTSLHYYRFKVPSTNIPPPSCLEEE